MEGGEGGSRRVVRSDRVAEVQRGSADTLARRWLPRGRRRLVGEADRLAAGRGRRRRAATAARLRGEVPDRRLRRPRRGGMLTMDWRQ